MGEQVKLAVEMLCARSQNMLCGLKGLNAVFKGPIERFNKTALQGEAQEAAFSRLPKQEVKKKSNNLKKKKSNISQRAAP